MKILLEIAIDQSRAAIELQKLRNSIKEMRAELKKGVSDDRFAELTEEIARAQVEVIKLTKQQRELAKEFKSAALPKDSIAALRIEYGRLSQQISELSATDRQSDFGKNIVRNAAQIKKQIDSVEQSIGRFTGNVGNYRSALLSVSEIVTGGLIGGGLVVTINAISQAFFKGIDAAEDYGAALDRLSAITGITGDALKDLEARAQELTVIEVNGQKIVNTAQDIFEAFTLVGSARPELLKDADALQQVSREAIILSKASGDDLVTSVEAITTTLGQFQEGAGAARRIVNELAAGSKEGASEIRDTTEALQKFGTTASVSNVSTAESVALIEVLADRQLKGAEAGTQLRNILAKLAGAEILPRNARRELEAANVSLEVLSNTTLPFSTRLQELGKLQGNTAALTKTFGLENLAAAQILTQGIPKYEALLQAIQGTDEAYKQAAINSDNLKTRVQNLEKEGLILLTKAFVTLEPVLEGTIEFMSGFLTLLQATPEFISEYSDELLALGLALIAVNANTIRTTATQLLANVATGAGTVATRLLGAAQAALPLLAVVAGLYAIVKAFEAYEAGATASEKATRAVAEAQEDIAESTAQELSALERNIGILKSQTTSRELQQKAIKELTAAYPDYLANIDLEKASTGQLINIQEELTASIYKTAIAREEAAADEELIQKRISNERTILLLEEERFRISEMRRKGEFTLRRESDTDVVIQRYEKENELIEKQRDLQRKQFAELRARLTGELPAPETGQFLNLGNELGATFDAVTTKTKEAAKNVKGVGEESEVSGNKTSKAMKAAAGSIEFLQKEVERLEDAIKKAPGDAKVLTPLLQQLDVAKKSLSEAEKNLERLRREVLGGAAITAPTLEQGEQPTLTVIPELEFKVKPDAKEKAKQAKEKIEDDLKAIEFPVEAKPDPNLEAFERERDAADEARFRKEQERDDARIAKQEELKKAIISASLDAAQTVANATFQIEQNNIDRERERQLQAIDDEFEARIAAAAGNEQKIDKLRKEQAKKREEVEKEAARKSKAVALKEAAVNTALAITKALTGAVPPANFILAALAAAAGAAQIAVISSQEFAKGGIVKQGQPGRLGGKLHTAGGTKGYFEDGTTVEMERDEILVVVNRHNSRMVERLSELNSYGGKGIDFAPAKTLPVQRPLISEGAKVALQSKFAPFAEGGFLALQPQINVPGATGQQPVQVIKVETAKWTADDIREIAVALASEVGNAARDSIAEGLNDADRRNERTIRNQRNRQI